MDDAPEYRDPRSFRSGPAPQFGSTLAPRSARPVPRALPERRAATAYGHPVGILPAVQSLLYVLVFGLFLMTFTVQPIRIPSSSMEPTLLVGDFLLLDKQSVATNAGGLLPPTGINRGDVVVFHDPIDDPSVHLVKRVIGLPGDHLHLRNGIVYLNGSRLPEPYAIHHAAPASLFRDDFPSLASRDAAVDPAWWIKLRGLVRNGELAVPPGNYFVLGDNRNDSEDSRYWGFVPCEAIVGKPVMIYFSWKQPEEILSDEAREKAKERALLGRDPGPRPGTGRNPMDFARWERVFRIIR